MAAWQNAPGSVSPPDSGTQGGLCDLSGPAGGRSRRSQQANSSVMERLSDEAGEMRRRWGF